MAEIKGKKLWQSYAKQRKVAYQENDTIIMIVKSLAQDLGIDIKKFKDNIKLKKAVEAELLKPIKKVEIQKEEPIKEESPKPEVKNSVLEVKKDTQKEDAKITLPEFKNVAEMKNFCVLNKLNKLEGYKDVAKGKKSKFLSWIKNNIGVFVEESPKSEAKKEESPKSKEKKPVLKVKTPKGLSDEKQIIFPEFKDKSEMKAFCLSCGLNLVDGYILQTKGKKSTFLIWMEENKSNAVMPKLEKTTDNPHSPSAGIGELESNNVTEEEVLAIGKPENTGGGTAPEDIGKVEKTGAEGNIKLPPLGNGVPHSQNSFQPTKGMPIVQLEFGKGNPAMIAESNSVIDHLNDSFQARLQGGMPISDFKSFMETSLPSYNPKIESDTNGTFFSCDDGNGNKERFPKEGYLNVR